MMKLNELSKYEGKYGVVFLITNTFNGKLFVGASAGNLPEDLNEILKSEEGSLLSGAIAKYNRSAFTLKVLKEDVKEDLLEGFTNYYISKYKSLVESGNGYNKLIRVEPFSKPKYYIVQNEETFIFDKYEEVADFLDISISYATNIFNGKRQSDKYNEVGLYKDGIFEKVEYEGRSEEYIKYEKGKKSKEAIKKANDKILNAIKEENIKKVLDADITGWLDKEILKEEIEPLLQVLDIKSTSGKPGKWSTAKKYLLQSGKYEVTEKKVMVYGESFKVIIISKAI